MNRGFGFYFTKGFLKAWNSLFRRKNYFNYFILLGACILSYMFIITIPFGRMIKVRLSKLSSSNANIKIDRTFAFLDKKHIYSKTWLLILSEGLIILGTLLIIGIFTGLLYITGLYCTQFLPSSDGFLRNNLPTFMEIPGFILSFVSIITLALLFRPTAFILESEDDIKISSVLLRSVETIKRRGGLTLLFTYLVHIIINGLIIGLLYFFYSYYMSSRIYAMKVIGIVLMLIFGMGYFLILFPLLTLALFNSEYLLINDIVLDRINSNGQVKGIYIKSKASNRKRNRMAHTSLVDLFNGEKEVKSQVVETSAQEEYELPQEEKVEASENNLIEDSPIQENVKEEVVEEKIPTQKEKVEEAPTPLVEEKVIPQEESKVEVKVEPQLKEEEKTPLKEKEVKKETPKSTLKTSKATKETPKAKTKVEVSKKLDVKKEVKAETKKPVNKTTSKVEEKKDSKAKTTTKKVETKSASKDNKKVEPVKKASKVEEKKPSKATSTKNSNKKVGK